MRGSVIELTESVLPVTRTNLHVGLRESVVIQRVRFKRQA